MPRYLVERTFPEGLRIPPTEEGANICRTVVATNSEDLVTWVHSYVTDDKSKTYCIYDALSPEAIRRAARRNNLPVDKITEVRVLDPFSTGNSVRSPRHVSRLPLPSPISHLFQPERHL